jgi:undecaprenyl-diphosphatase
VTVRQAIVLGIVQGLTEFLPVSSSAHLLIVPWLLGWESPGLAFDAALHLGTLAAVIVYFWRDLVAMALAFPGAIRNPRAMLQSDDPADVMRRLSLLIALGTIPGLIAGLLGSSTIDAVYHPEGVAPDAVIVAIAVALIALALLLLWRSARPSMCGVWPASTSGMR